MCLEAVGVLAAVVIQGQLVQDTRCDGEDSNKEIPTVDDMHKQVFCFFGLLWRA
jgi:hypothetical protein